MSDAKIQVRISAATPEADLSSAVWPGVESITYPRVETPLQVEQADVCIARLERLRGIRPGRVEIRPVIESARGVTRVCEISASSRRVHTLAVGPALTLEVGEDALGYARAECELHARARGIMPLDAFLPHD